MGGGEDNSSSSIDRHRLCDMQSIGVHYLASGMDGWMMGHGRSRKGWQMGERKRRGVKIDGGVGGCSFAWPRMNELLVGLGIGTSSWVVGAGRCDGYGMAKGGTVADVMGYLPYVVLVGDGCPGDGGQA